MNEQHSHWMLQALEQAAAAASLDEVPIGCVIVHDPTARVIGRGQNRRQIDRDPTAHAEVLALREAGKSLGDWRLLDCTLYVTLEPCAMCAGAMINARLPRLVYGCEDPKAGAVRTLYRLCDDRRLNHVIQVQSGILAEQCAAVLQEFFRAQRSMGKK